MATINELVINFHMTEACNYRCGFCYATWQDHDLGRELHRDPARLRGLLEALADYFLQTNPLQQATGYQSVRLNFAGGEPMLLGDRFLDAVRMAEALGFGTSLITNGHYLDVATLAFLAPRLSILGVSCDAVDIDTQKAIGRVDRHGRRLMAGRLVDIFAEARAHNPAILAKLNTVVNRLNWQHDLNAFVASAAPDKWKLLRVLPVYEHDLNISDDQFRAFCDRHAGHAAIISPEDNSSMTESYLMVNPEGRFYQNRAGGGGYVTSEPILDAGVAQALQQVCFNAEAFSRRYVKIPMVGA